VRDDLCIMRKVVDKFVLFVDSFYCTQVRFCFSAVGDFVFMVALRNGQTIISLPCGFFLSSFFFLRLISAVADWMSTILLHMAWP